MAVPDSSEIVGVGGTLSNRRAQLCFKPRDHFCQAGIIFQIRKQKWPFVTHPLCVALHHFQRRADIRCKINFIDESTDQIG